MFSVNATRAHTHAYEGGIGCVTLPGRLTPSPPNAIGRTVPAKRLIIRAAPFRDSLCFYFSDMFLVLLKFSDCHYFARDYDICTNMRTKSNKNRTDLKVKINGPVSQQAPA